MLQKQTKRLVVANILSATHCTLTQPWLRLCQIEERVHNEYGFPFTGHGRPGKVKDGAERKQQLQLIKERESQRGFGELPLDHSLQRREGDY